MASPIRFETIEKRHNLKPGILEEYSKIEGFPVSGTGVAVEADVVAWLQLHFHVVNPSAPVAAAAPLVLSESLVEPSESVDQNGVVWITIRIPVVKTAPAAPGSNPAPSFRISSKEYHLRKAWGAMHSGCKNSHSQLRNGNHVDRMGHSLKFLLEQVAIACGFAPDAAIKTTQGQ